MSPAPPARPKAPPLRVLGVTNSLRTGSLNRMALALAGDCLPEGMVMEVHDLRDIPFYTHEQEQEGIPAPVLQWGQALADADGVVLSSPEYNHSIPPVIKNAIDWASRLKPQPFEGKPVMLISATPGFWAEHACSTSCVACSTPSEPRPWSAPRCSSAARTRSSTAPASASTRRPVTTSAPRRWLFGSGSAARSSSTRSDPNAAERPSQAPEAKTFALAECACRH
jgi:hypothetical protein